MSTNVSQADRPRETIRDDERKLKLRGTSCKSEEWRPRTFGREVLAPSSVREFRQEIQPIDNFRVTHGDQEAQR